MNAARSITEAPAATAICAPQLAKSRSNAGQNTLHAGTLLRRDSVLPTAIVEQYRAGAIVTPVGGMDARKIFMRDGQVRLDALAVMLIDHAVADSLAPYLGVIRHELGLAPGADPRLTLRERLHPEDASERPPPRAPAIARLARVLRSLERNRQPDLALEQLTEDLRFLTLFAPAPLALSGGGLNQLLRDIAGEAPEDPTPPAGKAGRIIQMRPRGNRA